MQDFSFQIPTRLRLQRGGASRIGELLGHCQRPLLISDAGVLRAGLLDGPLAGLAARDVMLFTEVVADPPVAVVEAALAAAQRHDADAVIGLGGGSAMDVAKLVALLAGGGEQLDSLYGVDQARGPRLPLVLVPTTAGTGSELTPIAIVTTGQDQKKGVVSPWLYADTALLDAALTLGLPAAVTAATGVDAMVHAIEAYTSARLKNPLSDLLARDALLRLQRALPLAVADGLDIEAREQCLLGAALAGMAFANAPVAAVHALAYPLGARFHVPHGLSNALVLGPVLRFNLPAAAPLYAELGALLGHGDAASFVAQISALSGRLGLPTRLRDVGVQPGDLAQLAADAMLQTRLLVNNPRPLSEADALALYQEAW